MKLTLDQFNYLSTFEDRFKCALTSNYCRNVQSKDVMKIKEIYEGIIGQTYRMAGNCATCILNLMKKIGPIYFECKEIIENGTREAQEGETISKRSSRRKNGRTED